MTVKQLIRKLNKLPQDAEILISNNDLHINGLYKATTIDFREDENLVEIETDYEELIFKVRNERVHSKRTLCSSL